MPPESKRRALLAVIRNHCHDTGVAQLSANTAGKLSDFSAGHTHAQCERTGRWAIQEAPVGIEPTNGGFAVRCLTT